MKKDFIQALVVNGWIYDGDIDNALALCKISHCDYYTNAEIRKNVDDAIDYVIDNAQFVA